ncbi:MAG: hypothetical protein COZ18_17025 [Flexibacter sp. CG_4_10_14_3_um_filter_32_15]|nr:MAG: hypothetical protein COZ18_17025 [Flexibacter sp. CG_4_10_14_3_um_filter_32_15]
MGGVISRYALADMEQRGIDHDTYLYVSHDAPHQGANIPLGIVALARHAVDKFVATPIGGTNINPTDGGNISTKTLRALIEAPGTRQMLLDYIDEDFRIDNSLHREWQAELTAMGYPRRTRNIAMSNGSQCGNLQIFNPSDVIASIEGEGRTSVLTDFTIIGLQTLAGVVGGGVINGAWATIVSTSFPSLLFNEPALLLGMIPGGNKFKLDFKCRAIPESGVIDVYSGKLTYTKSILWLVNINTSIMDRTFQNPNGLLPMDSYGGGFYNNFLTNSTLSDNDQDWYVDIFVNYDIRVSATPSFNYISTPSALDVGRNLVPLVAADYTRAYGINNPPTGDRTIPFDNFMVDYVDADNINQRHISFNVQSGNWLAAELDLVPTNTPVFDCTDFCETNFEIDGEDEICAGENSVYSIVTSGTIAWRVFGAIGLASLTTSGNEAILTPLGSGSGQVILQATISNPTCNGAVVVRKTIWVGIPILDTNIECTYTLYR